MEITVAVRNFLDHLRVERGLAENSLAAYRRDLARFEIFLAEAGIALESVDPKVITEYQSFLRRLGLAPASRQRGISVLKTFFRYLARETDSPDPTLEVSKSKQVRRLPKALTVDEIVRLIAAAYREGDRITLRDGALLELLYGSGGRVSEIVGLDLADLFQFEVESIQVESIKLRGKGGKERIVPLGSYASAAINQYLLRLRPELASKSKKKTNALFLNQQGGRLTRQSAWQFVLEAAKTAGITATVSPHVFRHSYATHLLDGGADIRVVQELLGHASVTTTQIYTLITIDKVRETYALAHPRARG